MGQTLEREIVALRLVRVKQQVVARHVEQCECPCWLPLCSRKLIDERRERGRPRSTLRRLGVSSSLPQYTALSGFTLQAAQPLIRTTVEKCNSCLALRSVRRGLSEKTK
jgi:hypothetical protein